MSKDDRSSSLSNIVLPGTVIGVAEEYFAGDNVFEANGYLISASIGMVKIDMARRMISVKPFKKIYYPQPGSMVYAYVTNVRDDVALLRIIGSRLDDASSRNIYFGALHISQAGLGKDVKSLSEVLRFGDIIYVKIISKTNPFILSMRHASAGIVASYCPKCVNHLVKVKDKLVCYRCGYSEVRKTSIKYLYRKQ